MSSEKLSASPLRRLFAAVGPGLVTAAVVLGPGSITVSSKCGAVLGYSALWALVIAVVLMVVYTHMGARLGMASSESLVTLTARHLGRWVAVLMGLCGFLICSGFQTGNNVGVGVAMNALVGGSPGLWAVVFTLAALAVLWSSSSLYKLLEHLMMALVGLMILCFVGDLLMVRPDFPALARGLWPSRGVDMGLITAISATTLSVAAAAFQAYLVQSKGWTAGDLRKGLRDVIIGIVTLGSITAVIMVTSAAVLKPAGITVTSAADMALQLEPLLGRAARWLFLVGLWAGAFSSFIVNAMIGGTFLADSLGWGSRLSDRGPRLLGSAVMLFGAGVAMMAGRNPIQLLVMAQATTILGVPLMATVMLILANRRDVMPTTLRNGLASNLIGGLGLAWLLALSLRQAAAYLKPLWN